MNVSPERHSAVSTPPNMNNASGPCVPLTACVSRSTAPLESPSAADAELAPSTISGSVTLRSVSVQLSVGIAVRLATASGRRSHRGVRHRFMGAESFRGQFIESPQKPTFKRNVQKVGGGDVWKLLTTPVAPSK